MAHSLKLGKSAIYLERRRSAYGRLDAEARSQHLDFLVLTAVDDVDATRLVRRQSQPFAKETAYPATTHRPPKIRARQIVEPLGDISNTDVTCSVLLKRVH